MRRLSLSAERHPRATMVVESFTHRSNFLRIAH